MRVVEKKSVEIRVWMLRKGLKAKDIARELKVGSSAVTHWLNGKFTSRRIGEFFLHKGCPENLID